MRWPLPGSPLFPNFQGTGAQKFCGPPELKCFDLEVLWNSSLQNCTPKPKGYQGLQYKRTNLLTCSKTRTKQKRTIAFHCDINKNAPRSNWARRYHCEINNKGAGPSWFSNSSQPRPYFLGKVDFSNRPYFGVNPVQKIHISIRNSVSELIILHMSVCNLPLG